MSRLYGEHHRALQDEFETRKLADMVENAISTTELMDEHTAFIHSRDMFFLSTIDDRGRPTVSYKGGDPGFIRVIDSRTLVFPSYDGNGMFLSLGNINGNRNIGMLFIDFQKPFRLRLQGEASIQQNDRLLQDYKEADAIVRVTVSDVWKNCPRYVHHYQKVEESRYVPRSACETPLPDWKRLDKIQGILPSRDKGKADEHGGTLTMEELQGLEKRDD